MELTPGLIGRVSIVVDDLDTAKAFRSSDVPVLATPRVVALMEEATCKAIEGKLVEGQTSVGVRVQIDHIAPTIPGRSIGAEALLQQVEGRRLTFSVKTTDSNGLLAVGVITRVVVDRAHFLEKAQPK
ncbi:MAG: thioesterase [Acidimicrobiales bacterium]|nr:thioesterase [Acidimicrobiales bacterium]